MPHQPDAAALEAAATTPRRHLAPVSTAEHDPSTGFDALLADVFPDGPPSASWGTGSDASSQAARSQHPAGREAPRPHLSLVRDLADDSGSLVAEYGLLMVLGATITMLATKWATGGAIWSLFGAVLSRARALVGA